MGILHYKRVMLQVTGVITDSSGKGRYALSGTWDDKIEGAPINNTIEMGKGKIVYEMGESKVLWQRRYPRYVIVKLYLAINLAVSMNYDVD